MIVHLHSKKKLVEKNITRRRSVRLFSTKSFKPLGTLVHHKAGIQALSFAHHVPTTKTPARRHHHGRHRHHHHAHPQPEEERHASATDGVNEAVYSSNSTEEDTTDIGGGVVGEEDDDDDDEMTMGEKARRAQWLVSGGKDGRVVVWELMDFNGARSGVRSGRSETTKSDNV
jgi:hypothetical protein